MIGLAINKLLSDDTTLAALVGTKIYPLTLEIDTSMPAVMYTVDTIDPVYTKDGWIQDECTFQVTSYHNNYTSLQSVVKAVRGALELKVSTYTGITTTKIYMTGQEEFYQFDVDIYITRLTFTTKINANGN